MHFCVAVVCAQPLPVCAQPLGNLPPPRHFPFLAVAKVNVLGVYVEDPPNVGVSVQVVLASGAEVAGTDFGRKLRCAMEMDDPCHM